MRLDAILGMPLPTICVVDPRQDVYEEILDEPRQQSAQIHFVSSGRDALRLAWTEDVDLWVVNRSLSDMSGLDLCPLLKSHSPASTIYIVSDEYSAADERSAWQRGASLFCTKPLRKT